MTVLLIDLSSIAKKHWHSSSSDPNPDATANRTVAEVYALASGNPHVAICCDFGRSWRTDISPEYKANRPERESSYDYQYAQAIERLKADKFVVWAEKGYEADDLIATAATTLTEDVVIATADKDLLQLVNGRVSVKSVRNGDVLDRDAVVAKLGVTPEQVGDYLALVGDTSDNIKGAPGIGPKNAVELLTKYQSVSGIYVSYADLKPGQQRGLDDLRPRLETVRQLIALRTDAPIVVSDVLTPREAPPLEEPTVTEDSSYLNLAEGIIVAAEEATPQTPEPEPKPVASTTQALVPVAWEQGLEPRNIVEAKELSKWVHDSRQFLGSFGNPQAVLTTILAGRELGLQAMASLRAIHIIEGKPTLSADLIRALVIKSGLARYFRVTERTNDRATFETQRGDDPPVALTFSIQEAQAAGLVKPKSGWEKNPADMLVARASAKLARLVYPDVVHGIYTPEELENR